MVKFTLVKYVSLCKRFEIAYKDTTATNPGLWSKENPAYGHNDLVSLIVNQRFDGKLYRTYINGIPYYFNSIEGDLVNATQEKIELSLENAEEIEPKELLKDSSIRKRLKEFESRVG